MNRKFIKRCALAATCVALAVPPVFAQGMMGGDNGVTGNGAGGQGPGMMGGAGGSGYGSANGSGVAQGPGMMGTVNNRPVAPGWGGATWDYAQVKRYLAASEADGRAEGKRVVFQGHAVTIDMVAVQPGHPDTTFEVHGITNPTLVVPAGATVHLNLVNMDYGNNMEHGVIITRVPPPYQRNLMMQTGTGLAGIAPPIPWRSKKALSQSLFAAAGTTFTTPTRPGVYWYVCQTPGHAEKGMYGKFVVVG
ncbi:sulfocyanin-like copper-binding protein [Acidihalobacter ferrooxydans]|nr:sulfocyanin-like copper-binding protein [Acidihalobacter ferrooxydans]